MKKLLLAHAEYRFARDAAGMLTIEREVLSHFERTYLGHIFKQSGPVFINLWDYSKLSNIKPTHSNIRRKA